jgi:hypothetical protein
MLLAYNDTLSAWMVIAGIFGLLLFLPVLGAWVAQKLADWATTAQAPLPKAGGFPVYLSALPVTSPPPLPVDRLPPPAARAPLRYVILHHTSVPAPHYDLMFELFPGGALATWRTPDWPIQSPTLVERLADHRRDYLDYEGPVSNNRGQVARVLAGTLQLEAFTNDLVILSTDVERRFTFRREGDTSLWWLELGQSETPTTLPPHPTSPPEHG